MPCARASQGRDRFISRLKAGATISGVVCAAGSCRITLGIDGICDDPSSWERIRIGDQGWSNDGLGWEDPLHTGGGEGELSPESVFPFDFIETRCSGQVGIEGRAVKQYEFVIRAERVERIVVDAATGMLVRYEERPLRARGASRAITYRYDPDIRIEPPVVDLEKRRATSLQRLREAAARSEPACRRETVDAIRHGGASTFEFDIRWKNSSHVKGFFFRAFCAATFIPCACRRLAHRDHPDRRTKIIDQGFRNRDHESKPRSFWHQVVQRDAYGTRSPISSYISCFPGLTLIESDQLPHSTSMICLHRYEIRTHVGRTHGPARAPDH